MGLKVQEFFDLDTYTLSYVVFDEQTKDAIIIDPVLDYDPAASKISFESLAKLENFVNNNDLKLHYILETHAHADHLTGATELKKKFLMQKLELEKISLKFRTCLLESLTLKI